MPNIVTPSLQDFGMPTNYGFAGNIPGFDPMKYFADGTPISSFRG